MASLKVLIVDDSNFFRQRLKEMLNDHTLLSVIGVATNGKEAIEKAEALKPDVITMDYEMPIMDGVTAVREIMARHPVPILMFSSLTYEGARITLDALEAGAVDFLAKDFAEVSRHAEKVKRRLQDRLLAIAHKKLSCTSRVVSPSSRFTQVSHADAAGRGVDGSGQPPFQRDSRYERIENRAHAGEISLKNRLSVIIIGASTGGPVALTEVLTTLSAQFPVPIVVIQHMPQNFTKAFAERLNHQCRIRVKEAEEGEALRPGLALLAPGGKQLMFDRNHNGTVKIFTGDNRVIYKPSVDITFASAANAYGNRVLGVVMTGMGSDGCEGARLLKQKGAVIWSQDEASSVIYGMPMAVAKARLTDRVLSLKEFGPQLMRAV